MTGKPWKVSLHGGHSGEFCEHAKDTLREVLEAAVAAGYDTFGVSEHVPRSQERFLYTSEREKGYDLARLNREFEAYAAAVRELSGEFADRLTVLRGFEIEVIPGEYRDEMLGWRRRFGFEYMVGSVHYVDEITIDGPRAEFERAREGRGGLEPLAIAYYQKLAEMIEALQPEVVGHFDLIRLNAGQDAVLDTPAIRAAAETALEAASACSAILDINTAGYRKGLGMPYPAPWILERAGSMGIGVCFGDDSHGIAQVGAGIDEARGYLLDNGIDHVTVLARADGALARKRVPLQ